MTSLSLLAGRAVSTQIIRRFDCAIGRHVIFHMLKSVREIVLLRVWALINYYAINATINHARIKQLYRKTVEQNSAQYGKAINF